MDRAIPKEEIRRRRIGLALRVGVAVAVVIGAVAWIVGRLQTGVKQKSLVFYTVDSGTIEMGVSAYGKVVPAFEERITSPVGRFCGSTCRASRTIIRNFRTRSG